MTAHSQQAHRAEVVRESAERPSFRALFDSELTFMWNTLRRLGVAERDVEDVAHETFVVVSRLLDEYDPSRPLRPWLFAIARRTASDYRRRARHRYELLAGAQETALSHDQADGALLDAEEKNLARRALLCVPEERRAVLILHDFEEAAMQDVALALEIPLNTGYSRLRVAREEFVAAAQKLVRTPRKGAP
jgi:RNA polymerase sigma-70 factor (ECF subfamily)